MTTLNDILPLGKNRILVLAGGRPSLKRIYESGGPGGPLTTHTSTIHGGAVKRLKSYGFVFLEENAWPWDTEGKLAGRNPSMPQIKWANGDFALDD